MYAALRRIFSLVKADTPTGYRAEYKVLDNPNPVGVNNVVLDARMMGLHPLQGAGTFVQSQMPPREHALALGQQQQVMAQFDPSGQTIIGLPLSDPNSPSMQVDPAMVEPFA